VLPDLGLKRALAHVLFVGGPPDAGKTTVADRLGARYGLTVYHFDRSEPAHLRRADPVRHPALHELARQLDKLGAAGWREAFWVRLPPAEMARRTRASWSEPVSLAVEDLLELSRQADTPRPIVAEGPASSRR